MIDGRNDQYPDPEDRPRPIRDIDDRADDAYEEVRQRVIESPCPACKGKGYQIVDGNHRGCPSCRGFGYAD